MNFALDFGGSVLRCSVFRQLIPAAILALASTGASALGLGELRGMPALGENPRLEIEILGDAVVGLDASCFRLIKPTQADLPAMRRATLEYKKGKPSLLIVRSDAPLRDPVLVVAIHLGCGHELIREYTLLASPVVVNAERSQDVSPPVTALRPPSSSASMMGGLPSAGQPAKPRRVNERAASKPLVSREQAPRIDRVALINPPVVGEPFLRFEWSLASVAGKAFSEPQRDILRMEFRMLMAMQEQATTQLETAEKLRNMEATLGELQQRASAMAGRVEAGASPEVRMQPAPVEQPVAVVPAPPVSQPPVAAESVAQAPKPAQQQPVVEEEGWVSDSVLYGALLGMLLGGLGWLGWRRYQDKLAARQDAFIEPLDGPESVPSLEIDPQRGTEFEEQGGVDLPVEPAVMGAPMKVDLELEASRHSELPGKPVQPVAPASGLDSMLSISATTVDEHFEANPVMELADIMLSFGRVKGAAQALQEYIDNNPQEALQPWVRLMEVYRLAGMRAEFEAVARNLNQNFNVEVQQWETASDITPSHHALDLVLDEKVESVTQPPVAPRPMCLEDMPRIMSLVCEQWGSGDVVGYMYQLLRDNRGGQRQGFAMPVVEEILFLIELKETANRLERAQAAERA